MKAFLAFNHLGINHETHMRHWTAAIKALGWEFSTVARCDFTVMWGPNPEFDETRARGKPVLMLDFPYWNRGGKVRDGNEYYKVSLNGQHPTEYLFTEKHGLKRYRETGGPEIKEWRKGGEHILLAGMGVKAAAQFGYAIGEWEHRAAVAIQKQTNMPIHFRPKPGQRPVASVPGAIIDIGDRPIEAAIEGAHCVVCHHGNPTVHALAMGVPVFMNGPIGVASHLASFELNKIMSPVYPQNRQEFFNNLAYWQWSVYEITSGMVLLDYAKRGLI